MKYIDVHAHLDMDKFNEDRDSVVDKCRNMGVYIVSSGVNSDANRKVLEYSKKYENVLAAFGIYPIDAIKGKFPDLEDDGHREMNAFSLDDELKWIENHKNDCILIGEIGLDFKVIEVNDEIKRAQVENFEKIIEFAKKIDKPILIHSRGAELECIELMEKHHCKKVIMHCFCGKKALIRRIVENGWYLSIPAVITRLEHFQMVSKIVPLNHLLLETDAPYLSPVVGERNDSSNIIDTVEEIAKIKELSNDEVSVAILNNSKKILGL